MCSWTVSTVPDGGGEWGKRDRKFYVLLAVVDTLVDLINVRGGKVSASRFAIATLHPSRTAQAGFPRELNMW
jgi:hypothetical protein